MTADGKAYARLEVEIAGGFGTQVHCSLAGELRFGVKKWQLNCSCFVVEDYDDQPCLLEYCC